MKSNKKRTIEELFFGTQDMINRRLKRGDKIKQVIKIFSYDEYVGIIDGYVRMPTNFWVILETEEK